MKLRTNFSVPFDARLPWMAGLVWGVAALALVAAGFLVLGALRFKSEIPGLADAWAHMEKEPPPVSSAPPVPAGELENIRRDLKALNALEAGGGRAAFSLLARLERLMPPGARLLSFQQDLSLGEIHLVVESAHIGDLLKFLEALEKDGSFSRVNLVKQAQTQGGQGVHRIRFFLELSDGLS
jgi:hypothetical protein